MRMVSFATFFVISQLLPQMLFQQVREEHGVLFRGENGPGRNIIAAAFALIEGSVFLHQLAAVRGAAGNKDEGSVLLGVEQDQLRRGLHIAFGHVEGVVQREVLQSPDDQRRSRTS